MSLIESNINKNKFRLLLTLIFLGMIAVAGCSKNDMGTNSYTGGSTKGSVDTTKVNTGGGTGGGSGGYGNGGYGNTSTSQVMMKNMSFSPSSISVNAGTTVTWTNMDSYAHTVTSGTPGHPDGKFDSGAISSGGTYSYTFSSKGTYNYYCRYHSSMMTGTVTVQ
ncbi:MAG: plastocyanin/azurin family copper-binding protein [Syntrophomonadaceae bacterium]